jgi:hypothetical protein
MSIWIRVTARVGALIFLGFAVVRFWIGYFSSIRAEEEATAGGVVIDHTFAINHSTIVFAFLGALLLILSFLLPRKNP